MTLPYGTVGHGARDRPADVTGMSWGAPAWTVDTTPVVGTTATFTIGDRHERSPSVS